MLYVPSIAAVSASFEEAKRPLTVGIVGSGAGIGDPIPLSTSFILAAKLTRWYYLSYLFPPAAATDRLWMDCPHHGLSLAFWLPIYLHHTSIQTQQKPNDSSLRRPIGIQRCPFHALCSGLLRLHGLLHTSAIFAIVCRDGEHECENHRPCFLTTSHRQRNLNHRPHLDRFHRGESGPA